MRSVYRILGLLSLSLIIAAGVIYNDNTANAAPAASTDDCAKKRARGRRCDDDNRNGNSNRNSNYNSNQNGNSDRNSNNNSYGNDNS